jgi:hypothetical protein
MSTLSAPALDVLKLAVADHRTIRLPIITDRNVFAQIQLALTRLAGGGSWDRRELAYVYQQDPRPDLERLTGTTVIPTPCPTRDKEMSYWPTPTPLAQLLAKGLDIPEGGKVLEPSAGDGQLVRAIRDAYPFAHIDAVEPNDGRRIALQASGGSGLHVFSWTFEEYAQKLAEGEQVLFDAVVMNPPFTLPGHRYAWAEHLVLAWDLLRPGGQLRAIVPASLDYGRQRPIAAARALLTAAGAVWGPAPAGAFLGAGTGVHTLIVEATKP